MEWVPLLFRHTYAYSALCRLLQVLHCTWHELSTASTLYLPMTPQLKHMQPYTVNALKENELLLLCLVYGPQLHVNTGLAM